MPDGLYERDALAWSEMQGNLLRRLAAGERVNDAIDWTNVIEEVHDVGVSEWRACRSLFRQAVIHLLKLHAWPASTGAAGWRAEITVFLADAREAFSPSMKQRLVLADEYAKALLLARASTDLSGPPRPMPDECPFELSSLLADDATALLAILAAASPGP